MLWGKVCYFRSNFIGASGSLSHDIIGDFNFFSTNVVLGGNAKVMNHCFLGLNSTVKSGVCLNDYTLLGSACNMLKDSVMGGGILAIQPGILRIA